MGKLIFDVTPELLRIIAHSKANACREPYTGKAADAGLFLVKDEGVYLMSAANESLKREDGKGNVVAYAVGHDPREGETWEADRAVCGGDDFAEFLPVKGAFESAKENDRIEVRLNKRSISIVLHQ